MSEKKRTTMTIIETHEVWIIRIVPEPSEQEAPLVPTEIKQSLAVASLSELNNSSETNEDEEP